MISDSVAKAMPNSKKNTIAFVILMKHWKKLLANCSGEL